MSSIDDVIHDDRFVLIPKTVYTVFFKTHEGVSTLCGEMYQLDIISNLPNEVWVIDPWGGEGDKGRYASAPEAAKKLVELMQAHMKPRSKL